DRHWNIAASNRAVQELYEGVAPELLVPPVNALRLSLHPRGVAQRIENLAEWRAPPPPPPPPPVHPTRGSPVRRPPDRHTDLSTPGVGAVCPGREGRTGGARRRVGAPPPAKVPHVPRAPALLQHDARLRNPRVWDARRSPDRALLPRRCGDGSRGAPGPAGQR